MQWAEVYTAFGNSLPKEVIVHTWATENYGDGQNDQVIKPLQGGYNVLLSPQMRDPKPCAKDLPTGWYLDNVRTTPLKNERWPSTRLTPANICLRQVNIDWSHFYKLEPCDGVPDDLCPGILGGEAAMWGEMVDDSNFELTVWPRAAALAERLWSPRSHNDTIDAHDRIMSLRCLLNRRGVAAASPTQPGAGYLYDARKAPAGPGSCYGPAKWSDPRAGDVER